MTDGTAEFIDRVRSVSIQVKPCFNDVPLGINGSGTAGQVWVRMKFRLQFIVAWIAVGVAQFVHRLVTGGTTIVSWNFFEVVIDRQFWKADLLNPLRRSGDVETRETTDDGSHLIDDGTFTIDFVFVRKCSLDAIHIQLKTILFLHQNVDITFKSLKLFLGGFKFIRLRLISNRKFVECFFGRYDGRLNVPSGRSILTAVDHAVIE